MKTMDPELEHGRLCREGERPCASCGCPVRVHDEAGDDPVWCLECYNEQLGGEPACDPIPDHPFYHPDRYTVIHFYDVDTFQRFLRAWDLHTKDGYIHGSRPDLIYIGWWRFENEKGIKMFILGTVVPQWKVSGGPRPRRDIYDEFDEVDWGDGEISPDEELRRAALDHKGRP